MTIIAAWRHHNDNVAIASDSRLSFMDTYMDNCVKVFSIPLTISGPYDNETKHKDVLFSANLGIAFCGKADVAYMIAEATRILLSEVQTIPTHHAVSMDMISEFIKLLFQKIISNTFNLYMDSADPEILVVGYCQQENRIRAFKLFAGQADKNGYSTFFKTEVLTDSQPCFLGSGKNDACKSYEQQTIKNSFRVIRQLIEDPNLIDIGGDIQFGDFNGHSFSVKGFQRPIMQDNRIEYTFAGLNVFDGDFSFDNTGLAVQIPCIAPFMEELFHDAFKNEVK